MPLAAGRMAAGAIGRRRSAPDVPRRVLIAHDLLLGDTIMLTPLLAKCRERWPSADIVMTCAPSYRGLYAMSPYGVRVLPYDPRDVHSLSACVPKRRSTLRLSLAIIDISWLARASVHDGWLASRAPMRVTRTGRSMSCGAIPTCRRPGPISPPV